MLLGSWLFQSRNDQEKPPTMIAAITIFQVVVQAIHTLQWLLLSLFILIFWRKQVSRLFEEVTNLARRIVSAKITSTGFEIVTLPAEDVRALPDSPSIPETEIGSRKLNLPPPRRPM